MSGAVTTNGIEIDLEVLRGVAERAKSVMSTADHDALSKAIEQLVVLRRLVLERGTTIARLRRLFHLSGSEKTDDVLDLDDVGEATAALAQGGTPTLSGSSELESGSSDIGAGSGSQKKGKNKGRTPASAYRNAKRIPVPHPDLRPGSLCPACALAKLCELKRPACKVRLEGKPLLEATCWECQRLRCASCGEVYTAPEPPDAQSDKYAETAVAAIALVHYGAGMPFHRLERMQRNLQTPLPSSTQWDLVRDRARLLIPVYSEYLRLGASGTLLYSDDTYARILAFMGKRRRRLVANAQLPDPERTGIFTTGVLAQMADEKQLALFFTGRRHAGENLAHLLKLRAAELAPPLLMCDALARNVPVGHLVHEANCLAHGRRHVVDEVENFPAECRVILENLGVVFKNDEHARQQRVSDAERLRFHQKESGPVLGRLRKWMRKQFRDRLVEENSGLGTAIRYLLKHWRKLTLFLRRPGAPLTTNIIERALKMAIRHRRNSYFFRSEAGARVADLYMSLIHTAELHGANPFDYLTELLRHAEQIAAHPEQWLPWNYRATMEAAATGPPTTAAA